MSHFVSFLLVPELEEEEEEDDDASDGESTCFVLSD